MARTGLSKHKTVHMVDLRSECSEGWCNVAAYCVTTGATTHNNTTHPRLQRCRETHIDD